MTFATRLESLKLKLERKKKIVNFENYDYVFYGYNNNAIC